ncbi:hypothetical protein ScFU93_17640 [Streptococcus canis]|nr:hypothetical protein ScFU93_17640 [Streptococcus canis]
MAKQMVAGSKKKLIICPPLLYSEKLIPVALKVAIPRTIATKRGAKRKKPFDFLNKICPIKNIPTDKRTPNIGETLKILTNVAMTYSFPAIWLKCY